MVMWPGDEKVLDGDPAERILNLCLEHGEEHPEREKLAPLPKDSWRALRSAARRRMTGRKEREERENRSMIERRRQRIEDEFRRKRASAEQRLRTATDAGRDERILIANRAQIDRLEADRVKKMADLEAGLQLEILLQDPPTAFCIVEVR